MIAPQKNPYWRYGLLSIAVLTVVFGGVIAYLTPSFTVRTVGLTLLLIGVYLGKIAKGNGQTGQAFVSSASNRPGPILWTTAIALSVAAVIAFHYLNEDALHGYREVVPVYAFAAIAFICGLVWAALLARLVQ